MFRLMSVLSFCMDCGSSINVVDVLSFSSSV